MSLQLRLYFLLFAFKMDRVIRELSQSEKCLDYETRLCNIIISRSIYFSSKLNIFENIELIKNAICKWKEAHVLLRSCILIDKNEPLKRNFALASDSIANDLKNVKFIEFSSKRSDYWKILYENELLKPFDHENGLLWRLYFIKDNSDNFYRLIFTMHHSLGDGRNHFCLLHQLLQIIESLHLNTTVNLKQYEILPSLETLLLPDQNLNDNIKEGELVSQKIPVYFKPEQAEDEKPTQFSFDCNIYKHDGKLYSSLDSIFNENKVYSNSSFVSFTIEQEKLSEILKMCKKNNIKLTGYLSTAFGFALREAHFNFANNFECQKVFNYYITASSRPKLNINNYLMGNYGSKLSFNNRKIEGNNLWAHAKKESDELHLKASNPNEFITKLKNGVNFLKKLERGIYFDEYGHLKYW